MLTHNYSELREVPEKTIEYWRMVKESENLKYLWYPFVQHIFINSKVDTSRLEICKIEV